MENLFSILDNKRVLITGGTGSFGYGFVKKFLSHTNDATAVIYSRDEMKQWNMRNHFNDHDRLRFFLGDIRDLDRLRMALRGVDYVIHAAATKIVPIAELDPLECVKTNVDGAKNLISAVLDSEVKSVVALSTDKASSPINLYGATKLVSDKLFLAANNYVGKNSQCFNIVRYGNVLGSRGSVVPFFQNLSEELPTPITDPGMTRFIITLDEGIDLVMKAMNSKTKAQLFVKKIPSMNILDIAEAIRPGSKINIIGIRPGEKLHEQMISSEDAKTTLEFEDHYRIYPQNSNMTQLLEHFVSANKVANDFEYSSNTNKNFMSVSQLKDLLTDAEFLAV